MSNTTETVEGYLIDIACVRENAREELFDRARTHATECALMGHCVESGYGLVTEDDRLVPLDPPATPRIVLVVDRSGTEEGIQLRVTREEREGSMETTSVEEV